VQGISVLQGKTRNVAERSGMSDLRSWMLCGVLAAAAAPGHAREVAGYVLDQHGTWAVQGSAGTLAIGAPVVAGSRVVAKSARSGDRIVVVAAKTGAVLIDRRCASPADCRSAILVPGAPDGESTSWAALMGRAFARLAGDADRYVATISRGNVELPEAVLSARDGRADFRPLFDSLPDGSFNVELWSLSCRDGAPCAQRTAGGRVRWTRDQPSETRLSVAPGLYDVVATRSSGAPGPTRAHGWVLVSPEERSPSDQADLAAAAHAAAAWGGSADVAVRRAFLRAVLDVLASR
jgi:hypothetical protein